MATALAPERIARVAIDGVDGSGKTTFANELAEVIQGLGRPVIRASVGNFHHPKLFRYAKGRRSPVGFFEDSHNYDLLRQRLLNPLSPGGSGRFCTAAFDLASDAPVPLVERAALPTSVLVFDSIFLHRPELRGYWDASVFLRTSFDVSIARCASRDGGSPNPLDENNHRYVGGQRIYFERCSPEAYATIVIDNNDLAAPFMVISRKGST